MWVPEPTQDRPHTRGPAILAAAAVIETAGPAIDVDRLRTRYGAKSVLEDISLTVCRGEIFGLLGLNGAGKTSLLKSILMLAAPDAGAVRLFGEPHHLASARSRLAYLPERFQPPGHLGGRDFVRLTLAFYGRRAKRGQTAALAEQLELDPGELRRPIRDYAKGTAQKLGLLAMLLTDLPLLVLDEPMSGLDPKARLLVKRHLAAYRARGRTILLSSHIPADHDQLCDRIAIVHRGRLCYVGAPSELQARHRAPTLESAFLAAIEGPRLLTALAP
jgi:ABC-2 type transport system ATP-binding protein